MLLGQPNAFDVLGLAGDATWAEVRAAEARLLRLAQVGRAGEGRSEEDIRRAVDQLADPELRLLHRVSRAPLIDAPSQVYSDGLERHGVACRLLTECFARDPDRSDAASWMQALKSWYDATSHGVLAAVLGRVESAGGFDRALSSGEIALRLADVWLRLLGEFWSHVQSRLRDGTGLHLGRSAKQVEELLGIDPGVPHAREELVRAWREGVEQQARIVQNALRNAWMTPPYRLPIEELEGWQRKLLDLRACAELPPASPSPQEDDLRPGARESVIDALCTLGSSFERVEEPDRALELWSHADSLPAYSRARRLAAENRERLLRRVASEKQEALEQDVIESGGAVSVELTGARFKYLAQCSCCLAGTEHFHGFVCPRKSGVPASRMAFPICPQCVDHVKAAEPDLRILLTSIPGFAVAALAIWLYTSDTFTLLMIGGLASFVGAALFFLASRRRRIPVGHVERGQPLALRVQDKGSLHVTAALFRNARAGFDFAQVNGLRAETHDPLSAMHWESKWPRRRRVLGLLVGSFLWGSMAGRVATWVIPFPARETETTYLDSMYASVQREMEHEAGLRRLDESLRAPRFAHFARGGSLERLERQVLRARRRQLTGPAVQLLNCAITLHNRLRRTARDVERWEDLVRTRDHVRETRGTPADEELEREAAAAEVALEKRRRYEALLAAAKQLVKERNRELDALGERLRGGGAR